MSQQSLPRILIVDDEQSVLEMLSDFLSLNNYLCTTADGGAAAVECLADRTFNVVLLDIKMPGMSGIETLQAIRRRSPDQQVLMITAVAEVQTVVKAMQLGALDYIIKPFALKDLLAKVETALATEASIREERTRQERLAWEAQQQRQQLEQRTVEIQALNRLFQDHLDQPWEENSQWSA
jgi:DNA-binding NtrC family response regulator